MQVLYAILMRIDRLAARRRRRTPQQLGSKLTGMMRDALERTRRLMFELRPQVLEREGLEAALIVLAV